MEDGRSGRKRRQPIGRERYKMERKEQIDTKIEW
jgi:hypothetical protein